MECLFLIPPPPKKIKVTLLLGWRLGTITGTQDENFTKVAGVPLINALNYFLHFFRSFVFCLLELLHSHGQMELDQRGFTTYQSFKYILDSAIIHIHEGEIHLDYLNIFRKAFHSKISIKSSHTL